MKFSCIVPAFNESKRIASVIHTLLCCPDLSEIIVVDDGSKDDTWGVIAAIEDPRLVKIRLQNNLWKAKAIFTGIRIATGDYIVMIDADLLNFKPYHMESLLTPIQHGKADVTISIRENSLYLYRLLRNDFVTWERVVPRYLLEDEAYYTSGPWFGLEVKMNEKIIQAKCRVKSVYFPNVITPRKSYKCGYIDGTIGDIRMIRDILSVLPPHRLVYQLWNFYKQQRTK